MAGAEYHQGHGIGIHQQTIGVQTRPEEVGEVVVVAVGPRVQQLHRVLMGGAGQRRRAVAGVIPLERGTQMTQRRQVDGG